VKANADEASKRRCVLVVDDEEDIREIVGWALGREGYDVTLVDNGAEAVATAAAGEFGLAFVDVAMPGMDGLATLRALKEVSPRTEVIMITAFLESTLAREDRRNRVADCLAEGARGCLRKPFTVSSVVKTAEYFAREPVPRKGGPPRPPCV
jgi:CheY-like chemotaxis protein